MNYKDITIEEAERINKIFQCEVVCDADKQEVILENILKEFVDTMAYTFKIIVEAVNELVETVRQVFCYIKDYVIKLLNKRIGKKRFVKLLQSRGMQRNDINKLIKNNKEKYTMWRYLKTPPRVAL